MSELDKYQIEMVVPSDVDASSLLEQMQEFAIALFDPASDALLSFVEEAVSVQLVEADAGPLTDAERADAPPPYFTISIPFVPLAFATEWHPTEDTGPFQTLSRGAFRTYEDAIAWGREKLGGTPYTVKKVG